jgi:diguanylate cyclase (GGDEF)-like protein
MATKAHDATLDPLTGLLNRAGFTEAFGRLDAGAPVALAMIDTDGFKTINDDLGHGVGDDLLRAHAQSLAGSLPGDAVVSRFGGDEFLVALPHTSAEGALILLEEVRSYLAKHVPLAAIGRPVPITVGIAARPPHGDSLDELLRAADGAMYRAKAEGRNRVAIYVDEKMVMKSNYYDRASLARLSKLAENVGRTEASLLREALDDLFTKHQGEL